MISFPTSRHFYWEGLEEGKSSDIPPLLGCHWFYLLPIPPSRHLYWEGLEEGKSNDIPPLLGGNGFAFFQSLPVEVAGNTLAGFHCILYHFLGTINAEFEINESRLYYVQCIDMDHLSGIKYKL